MTRATASRYDSAVGGEDWVLWMELWTRSLRDRSWPPRDSASTTAGAEILEILNAGRAYGKFEVNDTERAMLELAALMVGGRESDGAVDRRGHAGDLHRGRRADARYPARPARRASPHEQTPGAS